MIHPCLFMASFVIALYHGIISIVLRYQSLFIHLPIKGRLVLLQFWVIMNKLL